MKITDQIYNRFTGKIMCGGLTLEVVLERHKKWVYGQDGGEKANLEYANMSGADMRSANMSGANMSGADMRSANMRSANMSGADMSGADMSGANMTGQSFQGVPRIKNIHQAVYKAASKSCALDMSTWHKCGTTHCRAGWVVTLAGAAGAALEFAMGTAAAAGVIYMASDPNLGTMPSFYCGNDAALEDMKKRADDEKKNSKKKVSK